MSAADHSGGDRPRHQKRRRQVGRNYLVPLRQRHFQRRNPLDNPRIVDQDIDRARFPFDPGDTFGDGLLVGHVEQIAFCVDSFVLICFQRLVEPVGRMSVDRQRSPGSCQRRRHCHAKTVCGSGYQRHTSFQGEKFRISIASLF